MNKKLLLIVCSVIALVGLVLIFTQNQDPEKPAPSANQPEQQSVPQKSELSSVNAEEKNELLTRLGLPFENDTVAITYTEDASGYYGVRIIVINKSRQSRQALESLLKSYTSDRGVELQLLKVEYR